MNSYHKRFLESFCAENIIGLFSRYRGGAKEITESFAMLEAARKYVPNLGDYKVVIVGDGRSPRTGAMFAYYTKADVISLDPQMNMEHWDQHCKKQAAMGFRVQRLAALSCRVEELDINCDGKPLLVVWPHSHADMNAVRYFNSTGKRIDIAMPCCTKVPVEFMRKPHLCYEDPNVESPKRTIRIWGLDIPDGEVNVGVDKACDDGDKTLVWFVQFGPGGMVASKEAVEVDGSWGIGPTKTNDIKVKWEPIKVNVADGALR